MGQVFTSQIGVDVGRDVLPEEVAVYPESHPTTVDASGYFKRQLVPLIALAAGTIFLGVAGKLFLGSFKVGLYPMALVLVFLCFIRLDLGLLGLIGLLFWEADAVLWKDFTAVKALGIMVGIAGILHLITKRQTPRMNGGVILFLALGFWATICMAVNYNPIALRSWMTFCMNLFFLFLIFSFGNKAAFFLAALWVITIASLSQAVYGSYLYFFHLEAVGRMMESGRASTSEHLNQNYYAKLAATGVFTAAMLYGQYRSKNIHIFLIGTAVACCMGVLVSMSRSTLGGIVLGAFVFLFFLKGVRAKTKIVVAVVTTVAFCVSLYLAIRMGVWDLIYERLAQASQEGLASGGRSQAYDAGGQLIGENPVFGVGWGNEQWQIGRIIGHIKAIHNDYISAAATLGLPGGLLFVSALIAVYVAIWKIPGGLLRAGMMGMWTMFLATMMFNPFIQTKLFWMAAGMCFAASSLFNRPTHEANELASEVPANAT
jgi:O-antigen ligase